MFIDGKFARPVAARKFVHQQSLEKTLNKKTVIVQAPSGCFLTESLSALLEEEGDLVIWLRFSPEDFDPGVCLLSLITAIQGVDQAIGEITLRQMRTHPGPVQGWPRLYKQLAYEVVESIPRPATIVLEDLHLLNSSPQTILLLGRHFLELLPRNVRVILTSQEDLPFNMVVEDPTILKIQDLKMPQQAVIRLLDENNISISVEQLQRAVHLMDGSAEGLVGLFQTGQIFGVKYLQQILNGFNNQFDILSRIVHDWLEALDEQDVRSMIILCSLGYNHPDINKVITGNLVLPPAPWEQELNQNWIRSCNLWRRPLRYALRKFHTIERQTHHLLAEHLSLEKSMLETIRLFLDVRAQAQAAQYLEQSAFEMMSLGQWELLRYWLTLLPEDVIRDRPWLLYACGEIKTAEGDLDAAYKAYRHANERFVWSDDDLGICTSLLAISTLGNNRKYFKEAYVSALQASRIAQASNLPLQEAWAEFQLGRLSVQERDAQFAAYHFEQATELAAESGEPGTSHYFVDIQSIAQAWQNQQHERKLQYKRYLETKKVERAYNERLQDAILHPTESAMEILASQYWSHLPLMIKYSGQTQLSGLKKLDRLRLARQRFLDWSWHIPGYKYFLKLKAIVNRIFTHDPIEPFQEFDLRSLNLTQTDQDRIVVSELAHPNPALPTVNTEQSQSLAASTQTAIDEGNGKQPRLTIAVHMLGSFKLSIDDILLEHIPGGNSGVLLRYLLHHRKRSVPREELMELFWPEADPESARNRLNVIMSNVRKALRTITDFEVILYDNDQYFLNTELSLWVDVDEFESILAEATHLENIGETTHVISLLEIAANLYQGDYMQEDIYEEWSVLTRERLRLANLDALYRLSRHYFELEQYAACASLCQTILEHDNCREDVHCLLMRCYARQGQYHLGLRQYQYCVDILRKELDVEPAESTVALYEKLRRREITQPLSIT